MIPNNVIGISPYSSGTLRREVSIFVTIVIDDCDSWENRVTTDYLAAASVISETLINFVLTGFLIAFCKSFAVAPTFPFLPLLFSESSEVLLNRDGEANLYDSFLEDGHILLLIENTVHLNDDRLQITATR